jgi:hypothetical protein
LHHFVAQIPHDTAVTATAAVHPHVSHRRYIYQFPLGLDAPVPAEWALLDVTTNTDMAPGDLKTRVENMLAGEWGVVDAADGFLLLRKGATAREIPHAFADFARLPAAAPASAAHEFALDNDTAGETNAQEQDGSGRPLQNWSFAVAEDWPRWRQTRLVATLWGVQETFDPATDLPRFLVVTPDGETLEPMAEAAPPALVWWQVASGKRQMGDGGSPLGALSGESWRITTLPLHLPGVWALVMSTPSALAENRDKILSLDEALVVVEILYRDDAHRLRTLSWEALEHEELGALAQQITAGRRNEALQTQSGQFLWHGGRFTVAVWMPATVSPGQSLDLWLQWQPGPEGAPENAKASAPQWPDPLTPFVHLRQGQVNRSQADGPPKFFLSYDVAAWLDEHAAAPDWRVLPAPVDAPIGETWQVVIGLYDRQTGERALALDTSGNGIANEFVAGEVLITPPPTPDQACALIPATCAVIRFSSCPSCPSW